MRDGLARNLVDLIDRVPVFVRRTELARGPFSGHVPVLALLESGPMTQTEIARALSIKAPTASVRLEELFIKGCVSKTTSAKDSRIRIYELTQDGRRMLQDAISMKESSVENLLSESSSEERNDLLQAIHILRKFIEKNQE